MVLLQSVLGLTVSKMRADAFKEAKQLYDKSREISSAANEDNNRETDRFYDDTHDSDSWDKDY